jgi:hypothetical protein
MARQSLNQEFDDPLVQPASRSRFFRAIRRVTALYQGGVQHGKLNWHHDGSSYGEPQGYQVGVRDLEADGRPDGDLDLVVRGDTVWVLPPGYRPLPNAKEHAEEFLAYLQHIRPLPGRWVSASSLQHEFYPRFLKQVGWPALAWLGVAHQFRNLRGVRKRQRDRRTGPDRTGASPCEYFIPPRRTR